MPLTPESYYEHHVQMYEGYMRIADLAENLALNVHGSHGVFKSRMQEATLNRTEAMRWKAKLDKMVKPRKRPDPLMVKPVKPNGRP